MQLPKTSAMNKNLSNLFNVHLRMLKMRILGYKHSDKAK